MTKKITILLFSILLLMAVLPMLAVAYDAKIVGDTIKTILTRASYAIDGYDIDTGMLRAFYTQRNFKPVWDTNPEGNRASFTTFLDSVKNFSNYHGLDEIDYPSSQLTKLIGSTKDEDSYKVELLVTEWMLKLAHELHGDTIKLNHLYPGWRFERKPFDVQAGLEKAIEENRVYDFFNELVPQNPSYHRLARALKSYRTMLVSKSWPTIASGPTIRPGERDARLPQIRARLAAEGYLQPASLPDDQAVIYDKDLEQTVENYQTRNGLKADGNIGSKTVETMNVPLEERIDQIVANMERWRHMPETMPARYVLVNAAAATIDLVEDGKSIYSGAVVVGRPDRKTPFIQSAIRSVIFNPAWHVPAKIARKDILPKLRRDPHYLEKMGFVINGSADDPHGENIDWNDIEESDFNFRLRQAPGDINSLGRLKFDFDNDFAVYMHGTPHKELFDKAERHQSSGCVRLRDPDKIAVLVLAHEADAWPLERVQAEVNKRQTHWLKIAEPLPIYIEYWTAFPSDDEGPLNFRADVYDYDSFLLDMMREQNTKRMLQDSKEPSNPLI